MEVAGIGATEVDMTKRCTRCREEWGEETPGFHECDSPATTRFQRPCLGVLLIDRCIACEHLDAE